MKAKRTDPPRADLHLGRRRLPGKVFVSTERPPAHEIATGLTAEHVETLTKTLRRRILRYFHRHGILAPHVTDDMLTWQGTGGFSLDASVRVEGTDRAGLERLVRYLARPPFALERLRPPGSAPLSSDDAALPSPNAASRPTSTGMGATGLELGWAGSLQLGQSPAYDPADPDPLPDFEFDQSVPDEFD